MKNFIKFINNESIKSLELCYDDKNIGFLVDKFKEYNIKNNFIDSLTGNYKNIDNIIGNNEISLLAIADNLYNNAKRFTTDRLSIHISIKDFGGTIEISSTNISSKEFNHANREIIMSGEGTIMSQEGNNNLSGQGIYLIDLSQKLKQIGGKIDVTDVPSE